jgi:hypothetical protein
LVSWFGIVWALILAWTVALAPAAVGADSIAAAAGKSPARFDARQLEHARENLFGDFDYEEAVEVVP